MAKVELRNQGTVNKNIVYIDDLTLYFSYETVVAFSCPVTGLVCRVNDWSVTTGKFLNEICPDKKQRISGDDFEQALDRLLANIKTKDI